MENIVYDGIAPLNGPYRHLLMLNNVRGTAYSITIDGIEKEGIILNHNFGDTIPKTVGYKKSNAKNYYNDDFLYEFYVLPNTTEPDIGFLLRSAKLNFPKSTRYKGKLTEENLEILKKECDVRTASTVDDTTTYIIRYRRKEGENYVGLL